MTSTGGNDVVSRVWAYYLNVWLPSVKALGDPECMKEPKPKPQTEMSEELDSKPAQKRDRIGRSCASDRPYPRNMTLAELGILKCGPLNKNLAPHGETTHSKASTFPPSKSPYSSSADDIYYPSSCYSAESDFLYPVCASYSATRHPSPTTPSSPSYCSPPSTPQLSSIYPTKLQASDELRTASDLQNSSVTEPSSPLLSSSYPIKLDKSRSEVCAQNTPVKEPSSFVQKPVPRPRVQRLPSPRQPPIDPPPTSPSDVHWHVLPPLPSTQVQLPPSSSQPPPTEPSSPRLANTSLPCEDRRPPVLPRHRRLVPTQEPETVGVEDSRPKPRPRTHIANGDSGALTEPTHVEDSLSPLMSRSSSRSSICSISSASSCSVWSSSSSLSPPYYSPEIPSEPYNLIPSPRAAEDLHNPQSSLKLRIRWQQRLRRFLRNLCCFSRPRTEVD